MTDRELIEKAARAAGYQIDQRASFMTWRDSRKLSLLNPGGGRTLWNAEDDDGDALRLAVKLGLFALSTLDDDCFGKPEPYEATRRAIVRAAAAIADSTAAKE
jgi:hypothetical protein